MQDENNPQTTSNPPNDVQGAAGVQPTLSTNREKVIQPSASLLQELQVQQPTQPIVITPQVSSAAPTAAADSAQVSPNVTTATPAAIVPTVQPITQSGTTAGFSQSDALAHEKKARRKKRLLVVGGVFAGLIALFMVFMFVMDGMYGLKTINFDNGGGAKFTMKFYKKYHTADAQIKDKDSHLLKLVSEVSVDGKAPVAMLLGVGHVISDNDWQKNPSRDCSGSAPKAFSVHNDNVKQDINLCIVSKNAEDDVLYVGVFRYNSKVYAIIINQDIDLSGLSGGRDDPNAQKAAQDILNKVGLQVYKDDLTEILQSIKVIN